MRHVMGLVLAGGLLLGLANESKAQFSLSIGNPYTGQGVAIGNPGYGGYGTGYGNSYGGYGTGYGNSYGGYGTGYGNSYGGYGNGYGYSSGYNTGYLGGYNNQVYSSTTVVGVPGFSSYSSGYSGYSPIPYSGYRNVTPYYGGGRGFGFGGGLFRRFR